MLEALPIAVPEGAASKVDDTCCAILPAFANRHGLITGATGTGKTVTLQLLAERFSKIGIPVFAADVKGDLSGIAKAGQLTPKFDARLKSLQLQAPAFDGCAVTFWDVFGEKGHPLRATVSDLGPLLLARMLNLNDTQEGVLNIVFKIADDNGLLLLDAKDLRAMLQYVADNASSFQTQYGNISAASVGAIQRGLLSLENQGADKFFGEPMLNLDDLIQTDEKGHGIVNILVADKLLNAPKLYASFLLWLLSELFEKLPEIGDPEKPKLVFFFDEAHLLFTDAPKVLLDKIEQVVRLIRSKGVGVYFVTQNPLDIPDTVLGQLGNRVQHALRAFTPRDQKAVKAAATTMRPNPGLDIEAAITELGVGEALVSFLDEKGRPQPTRRAQVMPPGGQIGAIDDAERKGLIDASIVAGVYEKVVDRESAYEIIKGRVAQPAGAASSNAVSNAGPSSSASADASTAVRTPTLPIPTAGAPAPAGGGLWGNIGGVLFGTTGPRGGRHDGMVDSMARSAARTMGSSVAREIARGVLGSILGKRR